MVERDYEEMYIMYVKKIKKNILYMCVIRGCIMYVV